MMLSATLPIAWVRVASRYALLPTPPVADAPTNTPTEILKIAWIKII
jgi:hypothetical protein